MLVAALRTVASLPRLLFGLARGAWRRILARLAPSLAAPALPAAPPRPKVLLLVRHGQSMHNVSDVAQYGDAGADAALFDAPLSPLGEEQVAALAGHPELAAAELAITSPLTRAVQTLLGAFPAAGSDAAAAARAGACPPIEAWPLAAEHLTDSCDIGSGASALARRFPSLELRALPEVWWYTDEGTSREAAEASREHYRDCGFMEPERLLLKRIDAFVEALRARPERVIAVFGHSDYFNFLMERHCGVEEYWLENAEVYRIELPPARAGGEVGAQEMAS